MKRIKSIFLMLPLFLCCAFSFMGQSNTFVSHAASYSDSSVAIWASSGTLSNGSLFKMVEVYVNDPMMIEQGFSDIQIEGLRQHVIGMFQVQRTLVIADYIQKVYIHTTDPVERSALISEFDVTEREANTFGPLRFLRLEFRTKRAFIIYSGNQVVEPIKEESFFVTKYTEINPVIIWGVQAGDTFVSQLMQDIENFFPQNEIPDGEELKTVLFYQFQTAYRRVHSNADRIEMQMSRMYLHEWSNSDSLEFIVYRYEANRVVWYLLAIIVTVVFVVVGLQIAKAVKENKYKKVEEALSREATYNALNEPDLLSSQTTNSETTEAPKEKRVPPPKPQFNNNAENTDKSAENTNKNLEKPVKNNKKAKSDNEKPE